MPPKVCSAFGVNMYNWPADRESASRRPSALKLKQQINHMQQEHTNNNLNTHNNYYKLNQQLKTGA